MREGWEREARDLRTLAGLSPPPHPSCSWSSQGCLGGVSKCVCVCGDRASAGSWEGWGWVGEGSLFCELECTGWKGRSHVLHGVHTSSEKCSVPAAHARLPLRSLPSCSMAACPWGLLAHTMLRIVTSQLCRSGFCSAQRWGRGRSSGEEFPWKWEVQDMSV